MLEVGKSYCLSAFLNGNVQIKQCQRYLSSSWRPFPTKENVHLPIYERRKNDNSRPILAWFDLRLAMRDFVGHKFDFVYNGFSTKGSIQYPPRRRNDNTPLVKQLALSRSAEIAARKRLYWTWPHCFIPEGGRAKVKNLVISSAKFRKRPDPSSPFHIRYTDRLSQLLGSALDTSRPWKAIKRCLSLPSARHIQDRSTRPKEGLADRLCRCKEGDYNRITPHPPTPPRPEKKGAFFADATVPLRLLCKPISPPRRSAGEISGSSPCRNVAPNGGWALPRPPAASPSQSDALMGHPACERPFAAGKLFAKGEKMHFRALESPRGSFSDGTWKSQLQIRREIINTRYLLFCFRYFGKLSAYRILLLPEHITYQLCTYVSYKS